LGVGDPWIPEPPVEPRFQGPEDPLTHRSQPINLQTKSPQCLPSPWIPHFPTALEMDHRDVFSLGFLIDLPRVEARKGSEKAPGIGHT